MFWYLHINFHCSLSIAIALFEGKKSMGLLTLLHAQFLEFEMNLGKTSQINITLSLSVQPMMMFS
jgi:hypothetical protein